MEPILVLVVDDHPMFREGLTTLLAHYDDIRIIGSVDKVADIVRLASDARPDVVLLDVQLPDSDSSIIARRVLVEQPLCKIIAVAGDEDEHIMAQMLRAGVRGFISKAAQVEELLRAIRTVAAGEVALMPAVQLHLLEHFQQFSERAEAHQGDVSKRDLQLLTLLRRAPSNQAIADDLGISEQSVKNMLSMLYKKLGVRTRAGAVAQALAQGWLDPD